MKTYARVYNAAVAEVFETDRDMAELFHPEMVWVDISNELPLPEYGWTAEMNENGWRFDAPKAPPMTETELKVAAQAKRDALLTIANEATAGMADAYIADLLDEADVAIFKSYALYKLALGKIDKQSGYPSTIVWPVPPA